MSTTKRSPAAGWRKRSPGWYMLRTPLGEAWAFADGSWTHAAGCALSPAASLEAAQFAAEDATRAIADQIYAALRGGL